MPLADERSAPLTVTAPVAFSEDILARAACALCAARAPHRSPPIARSPARDVRWRSNAARAGAPAPDSTDLSIAIQEATT